MNPFRSMNLLGLRRASSTQRLEKRRVFFEPLEDRLALATWSNLGAITINDNTFANPYPSTINVSGEIGTVTDVNVVLNNLSHTFPADLDVMLVAPTGAAFLLVSDAGDGTDAVGLTTRFDDQAGTTIGNSGGWIATSRPVNYGSGDTFAPPAPGVFADPGAPPTNGATLNGTFAGINPNGNWSLYVMDDANLDTGAIAGGWTLELATSDLPTVQFAQASYSASETIAGGLLNVTLTRSTTAGVSQVLVYPNDGTATAASGDFTGAPISVTFNNGENSKTIQIPINNDLNLEGTESFSLAIGPIGNSNAQAGAQATTAITILDDETATLSLAPSFSTAEGTAPNVGVTLNISGTGAGTLQTERTITADVTQTGGTATSGVDYTAFGGQTVTFNPGDPSGTTQNTVLTTLNDQIAEGNETVVLSLGNLIAAGTSTTLVPGSTTVTIDDTADNATLSIIANDPTANETAVNNGQFTVALSGGKVAPTGGITVSYTVGGTATATADYTPLSGTVTIPAGSGSAVIDVSGIVNDSLDEGTETVVVTLLPTGLPSQVTLGGPTSATVNIEDNDAAITVTVSPASVDEDGATNLVYTFSRTGDLTNPLTATYSIGGTATNGTDYSTITGSVTFDAGFATKTVTVDPTVDTTFESDETVILTVTPGTGYAVSTPSSATGTILNEDSEVSVTVSPGSVAEDGLTNLVYTFTRTADATNALTVNYNISGTATSGTDYSGATGAVTFLAGATTATVTVDPTLDSVPENDETVILTVAPGAGYEVASPSSATGIIVNDDPEVTVTVSPSSVTEDGATNLTYTFTRTNGTANPLTVNYSVSGTATIGTDYTGVPGPTGTVTFPVGFSTVTLVLDPTTDLTFEPDETAIITITPGAGYGIGGANAATGTILNDDSVITVSVSPTSMAEDAPGFLTYTFTRTGDTTNPLTISYANSGTATPGVDYTGGTGTATFLAGNSTVNVFLNPTSDTVLEPDETATLTVTAGAGYAIGSPSFATGTILNDEVQVEVSVSPASVLEDGATNLTYTFTRTGLMAFPLTVNYSVGGTATSGSDYTGATGSVTFPAGSGTAVVNIDPTVDANVEPDETVTLTANPGPGFTVGPSNSATGTILNDDPEISISVSPSSVTEDGAGNLVYTFTRTGATPNALTVSYAISGTASPGDFSGATGVVTFAAGSSTATVTIDPTADTTPEPDETVILTVTPGGGYAIGAPSSATGTILDEDTLVSVAVSPASVQEDGAAGLVYTFTRSNQFGNSLTVNYSVGGTATPGGDYTGATGTVTFAAGSLTTSVTLDPITDSTVEPDETAVLTVAGGAGYTVGSPSSATGTIANDDTDVSVTVSPLTVLEDGATNLTYTFTRNGVTSNALTVNYTVSGSANSGADYTGATGTVSFLAGSSTAVVILDPISDTVAEGDETAILTVDAGAGYNVGAPSVATGTIVNDDTEVNVVVSPSSVLEDGADTLVYTFSRTGLTTSALTVNYNIGGTATSGTDYTGATGTVTFVAGSSTAVVVVDPTPDTTVESNETVVLTVASGSGYTIGGTASASGTIIDDDSEVSVSVSPTAVVEDGATNLVYTFTRTGSTASSLTVNYSTSGTAAAGTDYTGATGTVTFAAGSSTATVTLDPTTDAVVEPDETAILTVTAGPGYIVGGTPSATGTIANDDTQVTIAVAPASVTEDGAGNLVYTFTRAGVTSNALTVNFTVTGTATPGVDFASPPTTTVTFAPGASTATVIIDPTSDPTIEPDETVVLTVTPGTGYTVGAAGTATGTITNDDVVVAAPFVVGFNPGTGQWQGSTVPATGAGVTQILATWTPGFWQDGLAGDFNGDGSTDVAARNFFGGWQVGASQAGGYSTSFWGGFDGTKTWAGIQVGDVNADGKDDIVGFIPSLGSWWAAVSNGTSFTNHLLAQFSSSVTWVDHLVADFTGDGRADVAARTNFGEWWLGETLAPVGTLSRLDKLTTWSTSVTWRDVNAADINGDGLSDIVGRADFAGLDGSQWWVAQTRLNAPNDYVGDLSALAYWYEPAGWTTVIADTDGDGKDEILGRTNGGAWWSVSQNSGTNTVFYGAWANTTWDATLVGDVDHDGKEDLIGRRDNGQWIVSRFPAGAGSQVDNNPANWSASVDWLFSNYGEDNDLLFP
jgi:subtilisin-like proprotein convertase family protein